MTVVKNVESVVPVDAALGDRENMAFAGTMITRGRANGVVVFTGLNTELGKIAADVHTTPVTKAPLLVRMERFTHRVAMLVGIAALIMAAIALSRGMAMEDVFLLAVALAVSTGAGRLACGIDGSALNRHAEDGSPECDRAPIGGGRIVGLLYLYCH